MYRANKIIEAGFRLICENGYHKTTTADIAKAAGVSTGIIYSYFKDKHDIFIEGLKECGIQMIVHIYDEFTLPFEPRKSIEKIIDSLINSHLIFEQAHKEISALIMTDEDTSAIMLDFEMLVTKNLETFLIHAGYDSKDLPEKTHIIYNMVESLCHEITIHKHKELNNDRMRSVVIDLILYTLGETGTVKNTQKKES